MNSKQKGKRGELELASFFKEHGFTDAQRGVQYEGSSNSPDVRGLPRHHVECKYSSTLSLYNALDQAQRDAGPKDTPIVCYRQVDGKKKLARPWVVILHLDDYLLMVRELEMLRSKNV